MKSVGEACTGEQNVRALVEVDFAEQSHNEEEDDLPCIMQLLKGGFCLMQDK